MTQSKQFGELVLKRRTEYSKPQIYDENKNNLLNSVSTREFAEKIINEYNLQSLNEKKCFNITYLENDDAEKETILNYCHINNEVSNIFVPDGVTTVKKNVFMDGTFSRIYLPESLENIASNAFLRCKNIKQITLPSKLNLNYFDMCTFYECTNLEKVIIKNDNIDRIPKYTFYRCENLKEINLPACLKHIDESAFSWCKSLSKIDLPDTITCISTRAFENCFSLKEINLPKNLINLGEDVFDGSGIETLIINHNVESISAFHFKNSFKNSVIKNFKIKKDVNFIDCNLFSDLKGRIEEIIFLGSENDFNEFKDKSEGFLHMFNDSKITFLEELKITELSKEEKEINCAFSISR